VWTQHYNNNTLYFNNLSFNETLQSKTSAFSPERQCNFNDKRGHVVHCEAVSCQPMAAEDSFKVYSGEPETAEALPPAGWSSLSVFFLWREKKGLLMIVWLADDSESRAQPVGWGLRGGAAAGVCQGGRKQSRRPKTGAGVGFTASPLWIEPRRRGNTLLRLCGSAACVVRMLWPHDLSELLSVGDSGFSPPVTLSSCCSCLWPAVLCRSRFHVDGKQNCCSSWFAIAARSNKAMQDKWKEAKLTLVACWDVYYLRIENAEGYVLIAVYLFIYLYACYSHNSNIIKPNRMKFGGMIGYYPGTIWVDFGIDRVKGQGHEKVNLHFTIARSISIQLACN